MKHLSIYESWKIDNEESQRLDRQNIDEIIDFMSDLKDLGCEVNKISASEYTDEAYDIEYSIVNGLGFSVDTKNYEDSFIDSINKDKENLNVLNEYMELSHTLILRLNEIGYEVAYFSVDHSFKGNNSVLISKIHITRK